MNFEVSDYSDIEAEIERREAYHDWRTELDSLEIITLRHELKALQDNRRFVEVKESFIETTDMRGNRSKRPYDIQCKTKHDAIYKYIRQQLSAGKLAPSLDAIQDILDYNVNRVFYACEVQGKPSPKIK